MTGRSRDKQDYVPILTLRKNPPQTVLPSEAPAEKLRRFRGGRCVVRTRANAMMMRVVAVFVGCSGASPNYST